jgi:hypothetical protein
VDQFCFEVVLETLFESVAHEGPSRRDGSACGSPRNALRIARLGTRDRAHLESIAGTGPAVDSGARRKGVQTRKRSPG